ncbi:MAG TPA: PilZ domain-containing protein [Polyangiaceae bacterium]
MSASVSGNDRQARFRELHQRAMKGALAAGERGEYDEAKEQFARALCAAQGQRLDPGQRPRSSFRVLVLFKVEVTLEGALQKAATMDVSAGGFSSLLGVAPPVGTETPFKMSPSSKEAISGTAVVVGSAKERTGQLYRVSFAFKELPAASAERLEEALIETVLQRSQTAPTAFLAQGTPGRGSNPSVAVASRASSASMPAVRQQSSGSLRAVSPPSEGTQPVAAAAERPPAATPQSSPSSKVPLDPDKTWDGEARPTPALAEAVAATVAARPAPPPERAEPQAAPDAAGHSVQAAFSTPRAKAGTPDAFAPAAVQSPSLTRLRVTWVLRVAAASAALVALVAIGGNVLARHSSAPSSAPANTPAAKPPVPASPEIASVASPAKAPEPAPAKAPEPAPAKAPEPAPVPTAIAAPASSQGTLRVKVAGHRVFVDGRLVGDGPGTFQVKCGAHHVRIGTAGRNRLVEVPCGGESVVAKP